MTTLVFLMGVSLTLNAVLGVLAWSVVHSARRERAMHARTRRDVAAMLAELQTARQFHKPMPIYAARRPMEFSIMVEAALSKYEARKAVA